MPLTRLIVMTTPERTVLRVEGDEALNEVLRCSDHAQEVRAGWFSLFLQTLVMSALAVGMHFAGAEPIGMLRGFLLGLIITSAMRFWEKGLTYKRYQKAYEQWSKTRGEDWRSTNSD